MDISFLIIGVIFFLRALSWMIVIRILMSWFAPHARGRIAMFIYETSDSVLRPVRKIVSPHGGIDWSPLIVIILIDLIERGIANLFI